MTKKNHVQKFDQNAFNVWLNGFDTDSKKAIMGAIYMVQDQYHFSVGYSVLVVHTAVTQFNDVDDESIRNAVEMVRESGIILSN